MLYRKLKKKKKSGWFFSYKLYLYSLEKWVQFLLRDRRVRESGMDPWGRCPSGWPHLLRSPGGVWGKRHVEWGSLMPCPPGQRCREDKSVKDGLHERQEKKRRKKNLTWIIPWPWANTSMSSTFKAVFSKALLTAGTKGWIPFCFSPFTKHKHIIYLCH